MVNFGTNLMKSAHNIALEIDHRRTKDLTLFTSTNVWGFGMTIFIVGSIVNFASFAFAAQSLLAALGTVQFISNVFFAKFVLKEKLTTRIFVATAIIMGGLIMAILCSNHETEVYTTQDLLNLYTTGYIFFVIMVCLFLVLCHGIYVVYTHHHTIGSPLPLTNIIRPVCYSIVSATIGTQSVLQSKCLAELIKATFHGDNQFDKPFVYIIIVIFAVGLCFWLYRMNAALKKFDGLVIIPLLQVFWTTSAIFQGGVYFQEFVTFTPLQTAGFLCGVGIVFVGVYLLTPSHGNSQDAVELLSNSSSHSSGNGNDMDPSTSRLRVHGVTSPNAPSPVSHNFSISSTSIRGLHGVYNDERSGHISHLIGFTYLPVLIEPVPSIPEDHSPPRCTSLPHSTPVLAEGWSTRQAYVNPMHAVSLPVSVDGVRRHPSQVVEMALPRSCSLPENGDDATSPRPLTQYKSQIRI